MTDICEYKVVDGIAVISMNNPPVNALSHPLRDGIMAGLNNAFEDDDVSAVVIVSKSGFFCGGADITEIGTDLVSRWPSLHDLCSAIESGSKLVIAAIEGAAFGGGFELALSCHYRFAHKSAKLGLPEVQIGLIPGAGGTQRLPRLIGAEAALDIIVTGAPKSGKDMASFGAVDVAFDGEGDFLQSAVGYANKLASSDAPRRSCAELTVDVSSLGGDFFDNYRKKIAAKTRGFFAPEKCIQAVEAACALPLEEGLKKEVDLFIECVATPQARAQQHIFFAERQAAKIPDIDPKTPIRQIDSVAIIGSGTMGGGIAMTFLNAGIPTVMLDINQEALERGIGVIRKNYEISQKKGRFNAEQVEQRTSLLRGVTDYSEIADVDLVIEAVFESMEVKKKVFTTLDKVCKDGAILATNTSTLDVNDIAAVTKRPTDVIGLHFFSPANVMRLLEIVRPEKTAKDVVATSILIAKKIKKVPVVAGVCDGFIGNRMVAHYVREAGRLLLEGASPAQIDRVIFDFGLAMGPLSMSDLAGIDIGYAVRQENREAFYGTDPAMAAVADRLFKLGRLGQKTGRGFYLYEGRTKTEDPEVMDIAAAAASEFGVPQRDISDREILERCIYSMVNEGAHILEERVAYRSSDIDVVYCSGYGFPVYRGGPMQYADETGLNAVLEAIEGYRTSLGEYGEMYYQPAPLLKKLVAEGRVFKTFDPYQND